MKFQTVLLLLVTATAMLEYCCATPADFGNSEHGHELEHRHGRGGHELERRRTRGRGTGGDDEDDEDDDDDEVATQVVVVVNPGPSIVQQVLGGISNFISNSATALTNCVTQSPGCLPFDTAGCLICLGLAALAGIGK